MSDRLTLRTVDGHPAVDVAGPDQLRLELVTERPDPPETLEVTVTAGDESETVELIRAINEDGTAVYQSKPFTLDDPYGQLGWSGDLGLDDFTDAAAITFSEGDTQTTAFAWHQSGARDIGVADQHLRVAERNFRDARSTLEEMEQTPRVTTAIAAVDLRLAFIRYLMAEITVYDEEFLGPDAHLARAIIRAVPLDPVAALTEGAGHMPGTNRDEWESWANGRRAAHREVRRDTYTSGMAAITLGGYQMYTDHTKTAQLYTIFSGESVMGKQVGTKGRLSAARNLALGYLKGKAFGRLGIDPDGIGIGKLTEELVTKGTEEALAVLVAKAETAALEAALAEGDEESEASEGSEDAFDAMAADAEARTAALEASLAEGDEDDDDTEESEPAAEPTKEPVPMTGGIPGLVWGILAAIAVAAILVIVLMSGGGSTTPTSGVAVAPTEATASTAAPTTSQPTEDPATDTATFGGALQDLVEADPTTYGLLQQFAVLLSAFELGWTGSAESAFELFNIRQTTDTANHPDGSTTGTQGGATDIVKVIAFLVAMAQQDVDDAFNQSDFPCGEGEVATTVCTDGAPDVPPGDVIMVGATLAAAVPLDAADRSYLYFVGFEDGDPANNLTDGVSAGDYGLGTDRRYLLSYSPSGGWIFEVEGVDGPSAARFIVLDDAVLLAVPADELGASPTFRFATFENAGDGLDQTNTSDWAGDAVPNVGAQLLPIVPLEPPTVVEAGSASDPEGDAGACASAFDAVATSYLVRGRQALFLLVMADDPREVVGDGFGLDISMEHPGGQRTWSIVIAADRTTMTPDDPSRGENPTVFAPTEPEIEVLFDSQPPPGSTLTFVTKDAAGNACDTFTFTTP